MISKLVTYLHDFLYFSLQSKGDTRLKVWDDSCAQTLSLVRVLEKFRPRVTKKEFKIEKKLIRNHKYSQNETFLNIKKEKLFFC